MITKSMYFLGGGKSIKIILVCFHFVEIETKNQFLLLSNESKLIFCFHLYLITFLNISAFTNVYLFIFAILILRCYPKMDICKNIKKLILFINLHHFFLQIIQKEPNMYYKVYNYGILLLI